MADKVTRRKIIVIDETLREGMQFQGIVFSLEQRLQILKFQEELKIDICQIGYPPAHPLEADIVSQVAFHAKKNNFNIQTAALGRAIASDGKILCQTGIDGLHFHLHIQNSMTDKDLARLFQKLETFIDLVRKSRPKAIISIAMLDISKTNPDLAAKCLQFLSQDLEIDILSLPDTSGIMTPNQIYDRIKDLSCENLKAKISVHCHNDMGMASANSFMGILAGASVLEVSALGIGERNGISDLFTTARLLKDQGMDLDVDTDNFKLFKDYYGYVDAIVREQTGQNLIQYNTPIFGEAAKTHVAGTHSGGEFGTTTEEKFYLNILCGRHLVEKYLNLNNIPFQEKQLYKITEEIKTQSITLGRRLTREEILTIVASFI
jgi:isopropylmalate/homocitrate/citramalate synthase